MDEKAVFRVVVRSLLFAALLVLLLTAAYRLLDLILLMFGASVIAVLLRSWADVISARLGLRGSWSLALALVSVAAVLGGLGWLFGVQLKAQFTELSQAVPAAWSGVKAWILGLPWGEQALASFGQFPGGGGDLLTRAFGLVGSVTGVISYLLLLMFGAVFMAADPGLYRSGLLKLIPPARRSLADDALRQCGIAVRRWMVGQLVSMTGVGVLTGLGLWLIGVPSPAALGLIAGTAEIIPWAGTIIAGVPILLAALVQSPQTALLALVVILVVQQIQGSLILPYVQRRAVSLPPALLVFGVVSGGLLFGVLGLIFAGPLLVVSFVLVKRLYVEEVLNTPVELPRDADD